MRIKNIPIQKRLLGISCLDQLWLGPAVLKPDAAYRKCFTRYVSSEDFFFLVKAGFVRCFSLFLLFSDFCETPGFFFLVQFRCGRSTGCFSMKIMVQSKTNAQKIQLPAVKYSAELFTLP